MSQYQRLLLIINPLLRHSPALNHAASLAKASGASLHIAALIPSLKRLSLLEKGDRTLAREQYLQDHRSWLEAQAQNLRGRGIEVTTQVTWAQDIKQDIIDDVTQMQPDLLIKEIDHASVLKRALFTPLDWHLLRHCPVPVYLVGGSGLGLPRKIVAAVEVSDVESADDELNDRIIKQACSLAMQCNAELHLLYACDISAVFLADMDGLTLADLTKELRRDLEKSFLRLAGQFGVPSDRRHFIDGHPVKVLSEFADEHNVDVIVMGRVQSHGLDKLLGSTTEHILYQVPCCVLAV
ncbi:MULTISPECIES: universal stress protein [Pseudomonas]|uniref:Universal stress protein n=1 Tax=Pseudomonas kielensis TaxID=2762577 RepID=A0A7X1GD93_9PSED|nr:universal stress protein [Pseudomonas kielensis]MBC2690300.1 universal stress protein [Pseudomonas kielensis]NBB35897.1 universal stress protein [Pseudomonas sp. BC115LW]UZM14898.1 universal stress protein [Pseudomonas kielensis]WKL53022.1 universal stress protein [Pseudomonas kielensis]